MDSYKVKKFFSGTEDSKETAEWLRKEYLPEVIGRFNSEDSRKCFALYQNEQIPVNERNLTDVRTRMGGLIEFEFARISNLILESLGITEIYWTYVVANRFPDLEVRKKDGTQLFRMEIKTLQCIAEEKSANFDTLIKDINLKTDFVVAFLWDWEKSGNENFKWDSAPIIFKSYVFHAYSLAMLRDTRWLNCPPPDLGRGYQGFDIRFAVTCKNGIYSREQGNLGKLTRIWKSNFQFRPIESDILLDTEKEYNLFLDEIVFLGFKILCYSHFEQLGETECKEILDSNNNLVGFKAKKIAYLLCQTSLRIFFEKFKKQDIQVVVSMTEKYKCTIYKLIQDEFQKMENGVKPKKVVDFINHF